MIVQLLVHGQDITVTHTENYTENTVTKSTKFTVKVIDEITSIVVTPPDNLVIRHGTPLTDIIVTGYITPYKGSVAQTTIPLSSLNSGDFTGYNPNTLGEQTITVNYSGQTDTFKVTVKDYVEDIKFIPDKIEDVVKKDLATLLTDNTINYKVKYASETAYRAAVTVTSTDIINPTEYNNMSTAEQTLKINYQDTKADSITNGSNVEGSFKVQLKDKLKEITITPPTKVDYKHGEALDLAGGSITLKYEIAPDDSSTVAITSAVIKNPDGSTTDLTKAASYDGTTHTASKTLTIEYQDPTTKIKGSANYPITITNNITKISMHGSLPKTEYNVGESLDKSIPGSAAGTLAEILIERANGEKTPVKLNDPNVTFPDFNTSAEATNKKVTVRYTENGENFETFYNINIKDSVTSIRLNQNPPEEVRYGEGLDLTGIQIIPVKGTGDQPGIDLTTNHIYEPGRSKTF